MRRAAAAGAAYFALVFALGFLLGTLRVALLVPRLGEAWAVAAELPLMLAASWFACGWAVARWAVPGTTPARAAMGLTAFALLMIAETIVGVALLGRSLGQQAEAVLSPTGLTGLAAQLAFALFPLLRRR